MWIGNHRYLFDIEKPIKINQQIDLVISLKSVGYHYPLETYLVLFKKCCLPNTVFIFDVIDKYYHEKELTKYFYDIKIIYEEKSIYALKRLYCKNFRFQTKKIFNYALLNNK